MTTQPATKRSSAPLYALRERAGLTQEQFGERAGMDATYLSQLENGHRGVRWATVMRILRALDLDLTDLAEEYPHMRTDAPGRRGAQQRP